MNETIELINNRFAGRYLRTVWKMTDLLLQLQEQDISSVKGGSREEALLEGLMMRMKDFPEKNYDFTSEAQKMNVSPRHFRRLIKSVAGLAPTQYQLQCRINKAMTLLIRTRESVNNVAAIVGIDDLFYFSALFKKRVGLSPSAYRKEFRP